MPTSRLRGWFESAVIAIIFALFVRTFVIQAFKIPTGSMEDNLKVGDHILVNRFIYAPRTGTFLDELLPYRDVRHEEVVVFKYPGDLSRDFIKRAVGLPGDGLEIRGGRLIRDGTRLEEAYAVFKDIPAASEAERRRRDFMPGMTVPDDHYFMLGDNRNNSKDSRYWKCVPRRYLKGRALMIYWSFDARPGHADLRGFDKVKEFFYVVTRFITKSRWGRTFKLVR